MRENLRNVRKFKKFWRENLIENSFRSDAEVQKPSVHHRGDHETKAALIACCGFLLSTFFIVWALLILVRFYIFDNIFYNLFLFCMLTTGKFLKI